MEAENRVEEINNRSKSMYMTQIARSSVSLQ